MKTFDDSKFYQDIKDEAISAMKKKGVDEDYIKSIEKAELTLAQYIEITSQLTCSKEGINNGVPDWTGKQVMLWARPDNSIQDMDSIQGLIKEGVIYHEYVKIDMERVEIVASSGLHGMALDSLCRLALNPSFSDEFLKLLGNKRFSIEKLRYLVSLWESNVGVKTFMFFYDHELTAEQAVEVWKQIDSDKISIEDLNWCAIFDAKT